MCSLLTSSQHDTVINKINADLKVKEENIKFKEKSPKSIIRRNRPKPKKKATDIKFTFDLHHNKIKSGDNGQSASKPKIFGGTIRFGRFLNFKTNNSDNIASYKITFGADPLDKMHPWRLDLLRLLLAHM
eukprot:UN07461